MLYAISTDETKETEVPWFFFQHIVNEFDTPLRHAQRGIDQPRHLSAPAYNSLILGREVDFILGHCTKQLFFESRWIGEVHISTWSHITADHDPIDSFRWIRHRHI